MWKKRQALLLPVMCLRMWEIGRGAGVLLHENSVQTDLRKDGIAGLLLNACGGLGWGGRKIKTERTEMKKRGTLIFKISKVD